MSHKPPTALGKLIYKLRRERKLYQTSLAHKSGVSSSAIIAIETGAVQNLRRDTISKLAEGLDVPEEVLIFPEKYLNGPIPKLAPVRKVESDDLSEDPDEPSEEPDSSINTPPAKPAARKLAIVITIEGSFLEELLKKI